MKFACISADLKISDKLTPVRRYGTVIQRYSEFQNNSVEVSKKYRSIDISPYHILLYRRLPLRIGIS